MSTMVILDILKKSLYQMAKKIPNQININYDGNIVEYTPDKFINFRHGYAISIHKAQGSEFDTVIMPITSNFKRMLYNKLVYTGVTRAKKSLIIVGEPNSFYLWYKQ